MKNYMCMGAAIGVCWGTTLGIVETSTFRLNPGNMLWLVIGVAVGVALGRGMNRRK